MVKTENEGYLPGCVTPRNHKREFLIRVTGIAVVSLIFTFFDAAYSAATGGFWAVYLVSFIRTAIIWNGSMYIIEYSITIFPMFKETAKLIAFQVVVLTVFVILVEAGEILAVEKLLKIPISKSDRILLIAIALIITYMISTIYASVAFFIQWKENLLRSQALEKANLEARYDTLRNQVNPHFLFNSLNTLLMLVQDNPVASRYVESISEIMRYMLQSRDKDAVLLRDELKIARDYVFIQQSRFGDKLNVAFDVPESFYHYAIPPLAIQMLLENAVKHNVVSKEDPLFVKVFVTENLFLVVENTVKDKIDKDASTGVGLENIQNRYLHLTGKNIVVRRDSGKFTVMLPLFEKPI
ncbi:MAG: sensor histidine kinase [Draconibacterium sp.]